MKVRYMGENSELLKKYYSYDIEFIANPRGVWVNVKGEERYYCSLTDFALEWKVLDKRRIFNEEIEYLDEYVNALEEKLDREKRRRIMFLALEDIT